MQTASRRPSIGRPGPRVWMPRTGVSKHHSRPRATPSFRYTLIAPLVHQASASRRLIHHATLPRRPGEHHTGPGCLPAGKTPPSRKRDHADTDIARQIGCLTRKFKTLGRSERCQVLIREAGKRPNSRESPVGPLLYSPMCSTSYDRDCWACHHWKTQSGR